MDKKGKEGNPVKCIVIPIEKNHLYEGKEGNIYLDIIAFDLKDPKDNQTHLVKQSLPKEVRDAMSEQERNDQPIIGSLNADIGPKEEPNNAAPGTTLAETDDVPF